MKYHLIIAVVASGLLAMPAVAADKVKTSADDLLSRIHDANQEEISVGEMAQQKAQSAKIKKFGEHLISDHSKADQKVVAIAKEKNIKLDSSLPNSAGEAKQNVSGATEKAKLKFLTGKKFDKEFVESMNADHEKLIGFLKAADIEDRDLKALVKSLLPQLKQHQMMAKNLIAEAHREED